MKINQILAAALVFSLAIFSCKKKESTTQEPTTTQTPSNTSVDLRIDTTGTAATISTVAISQPGFYSGLGTATMVIDMDGDAVPDLQLSHFLLSTSAGILLNNSDFNIKVLHQNIKIAVDTTYQMQHYGISTVLTSTAGLLAHPYFYGDSIKLGARWADSALVFSLQEKWQNSNNGPLVGVYDGFYTLPQFSTPYNYVGLKLNNKFAWLQLTIKDRRICIMRKKAMQN